MKKIFIILSLLFVHFLPAQNSIEGIITDKETNEPLAFANIILYQNDSIKLGTTSDFEGYYILKSIPKGNYDLVYSSIVSNKTIFSNVFIDSSFVLNVAMKPSKFITLCGGGCRFPIPRKPGIIMDDDFAQIRKTNLDDVLLTKSKVIQLKYNELSFKGTRPGSEAYFIDGMRVVGEANIPTSSIYELQIISNGIPAEYGNTTSSIINIKTKSYTDIFYH